MENALAQHKHVEHSFFARTYSGVFGPGEPGGQVGERGERQRDSETVLRTVDTHRRGMRAGAVVVGTTAGSQRSGTRNTSGIAQCAARAIATTEPVAEAAKNTLGSSCKKKTTADSGKRSSGKGMGALLDQEAIRGTQHAKIKADTQETLQALEKTIEAMGDNENTTGVHNTHGKGMQRHSKEAQQTTDPWHFKSSPKTKDKQEDT